MSNTTQKAELTLTINFDNEWLTMTTIQSIIDSTNAKIKYTSRRQLETGDALSDECAKPEGEIRDTTVDNLTRRYEREEADINELKEFQMDMLSAHKQLFGKEYTPREYGQQTTTPAKATRSKAEEILAKLAAKKAEANTTEQEAF